MALNFEGFPPAAISALHNAWVVEEHAGEAAFLWSQRAKAVEAPHFKLLDLARLDGRVEAHLHGLALAREAGWSAASEPLAKAGAGHAFAAAWVALAASQLSWVREVFEKTASKPTCAPGLVSALGWAPTETAVSWALELLQSPDPMRQTLGIRGLSARSHDPGDVIGRLFESPDAGVRVYTHRAAGELGAVRWASQIERALRDSNASARLCAAWALSHLAPENQASLPVLLSAAPNGHEARMAWEAAARLLPSKEGVMVFRDLANRNEYSRLRLFCAAAGGWPEVLEELIGLMRSDALARLAGFAFTHVTGVDLAFDDLERPAPERSEEDDPFDANLPWPDPDKALWWWNKNQRTFQKGTRYLAGRPTNEAGLTQTLKDGTQPLRRSAALELARLAPGKPIFSIARSGVKQARALLGWT